MRRYDTQAERSPYEERVVSTFFDGSGAAAVSCGRDGQRPASAIAPPGALHLGLERDSPPEVEPIHVRIEVRRDVGVMREVRILPGHRVVGILHAIA